MGFRKRFLASLLCIGLLSGVLGCGQSDEAEISREIQDSIPEKEWVQGDAAVLLSGSSSSPAYSDGLRMDNGKDPYMATIRERLELEAPEGYLAFEASGASEENALLFATQRSFLGMSVGGIFAKWFWKTDGDRMTGQQSIAAVDVYGAKAKFEADAKPYVSDPDKAGMVVEVGGVAGQGGYVLRNGGASSEAPTGISIIGEGSRLLASYDIPAEAGGTDIMADKDFNLYVLNENRECRIYNPEGNIITEDRSFAGDGRYTART